MTTVWKIVALFVAICTQCSMGCLDGFHGTLCDLPCSASCFQDKCEQMTGECGFGCDKGFAGPLCNYTCVLRCQNCTLDSTADPPSPVCELCDDNFYLKSDGTCALCSSRCARNATSDIRTCADKTAQCNMGRLDGFHGTLCSASCFQDECDQMTGECVFGCDKGFAGPLCNYPCVGRCQSCILDSTADPPSPVCELCDDNFYLKSDGICALCSSRCARNATSDIRTCADKTVSCPRRKYTRDGNVTVNFPATRIGSVGYSWERCIGGRGAYASAKCTCNYDAGAHWSPVTIAEGCNTTHDFQESSSTNDLKRLSELDINVTSIVDVLNNTIDLTLPLINLTAIDVIYAADILTNILDFDVVTLETLKLGLDLVNNLLQIGYDVIPEAQLLGSAGNRIIRAIDELTYRLWSTGDPKLLIVRDYVAAQVIQQTDDGTTLTIGLQLEGSMVEKINKASLFSVELPMDVNVTLTDVAIYIPLDVVQGGSSKLTFHIYSKPDILGTEGDRYLVNSHVTALRFTKGDIPVTDLGEDRVTAIFSPLKDDKFLTCGYWDYKANENAGGWRTDGCTHTVSGDRIICECDHLTNFAILIDMDAHEISDTDKLVLGIITKVGLSLSIVGLGLTVLTFIVFRHLRNGRGQQVLINLSTAMLCSSIVFLAGAERTESYGGCIAVAVLLHYFILVSFMWMLVEGVIQYLRFVKVLGTYIPKFMLKMMLPAWGVPLIPVIILLAYDYDLYYGGKGYCWLESDAMLYAFIIPVAVVIFANTIVFLMVIFNLCRRGKGLKPVNQSERKMAFLHFQAVISIFVVLGLTWVFGFFAIEDARIVFHYLFAIFNACQGLFIVLLFTAREKQIRTAWRKLLL